MTDGHTRAAGRTCNCASGDCGSTPRSAARASRLLLYSGIWGEVRPVGAAAPVPDRVPDASRSTRRASAGRSMPPFPLSMSVAGPDAAPRCSTSSASAPPTSSAPRSAARSRSRWRSRIPAGCAAWCWCRRPSAAAPCRATCRRSGTSSTRAATTPSGWSGWPAPCSAAGCGPSRSWSARCTSGARRTPWPPCTGWRRSSAGRSLPWLWAISQPTLVVAGDDDPVTPLVNHRIIASMMPRARLHTVRGGGHLALLDSAAQVGPVITSFLRED